MEMTSAPSSYPGFKFSPTDEELVLFYLRRKIEGFHKSVDIIPEIDITKHEPWDLPEKSIIPSTNEWHFFYARGRKYLKGLQSKRGTDSGFWKTTGLDRKVKSGTCIVGTKKTLVFHTGRSSKGKRTEWIMHEYCMTETPQESNFVVGRLRKSGEFNSGDNSPNEIKQTLTGESGTAAVVDDIQQKNVENKDSFQENDVENKDMSHGFVPPDRCDNPHSAERFNSHSEYLKKPAGSLNSTNCFDYESECDKKAGNLNVQDESCSSPKGFEGVSDDNYFDNILNDDISKLDKSSLLPSDLPGKDIMNDDYTGFKFEQPNESFPPPTLPFQETAPPRISLKSRQGIRPKNPLPFQGTAPRRIRPKYPLPFQGTAPRRVGMIWQNIENPVNPVEESCAESARQLITTMSDAAMNHRRVMVLVVLGLLVVFLAAHLIRYSQRHYY